LCGALKNIVALASGIAKGQGYGDNARAALITRGAVEIGRLGMKMGCKERTFSGLAGVGDLIVTATSEHSRNNRAGYLIGTGLSVEQAVKEVGMVVEGIHAIPAAMKLSKEYDAEMPIVSAVNAVINEHKQPEDVIRELMEREEKSELNRY
ncbi:MAG: glycerol-3-phosphate cytidylyltransferase, partial [Erysipelotrichaceae bacterium]|nr:glycerol-3-phosphate cytidylyltransferase [Erysipelotrichaceae bacterium]